MAESLLKPVQELLLSNHELPERYIYKGEDGANIGGGAAFSLLEVPLVDLGLLSSPSVAGEEEHRKLRSGLSSCGCFQAINHGLKDEFLDEMREVAKNFFALPLEEKQKYSRTVDDMEGYGNDSVLSDHQTLDWTDRLYLVVSPEEQRKLQLWPENFRGILHEYRAKLAEMNELLLKAMAKSLDLDEHSFLNQYGEGASMIARFNFYPPCPWPDRILGIKPHADGTLLTFLLQDKEVEGLQVLKDGHWYGVPIIPHALLVNAGDQLEIMSNGMFKSPVHRVVTNSERERNTLAVFCLPEREKEIGPVEELIDEKRPRTYKTVKNYVDIYFQNYQHGKRPLDAAKI